MRGKDALVGRPATNSAGAPTNRREKTKPGSIVQGRDWKLPSSEIGHSKPPRSDRCPQTNQLIRLSWETNGRGISFRPAFQRAARLHTGHQLITARLSRRHRLGTQATVVHASKHIGPAHACYPWTLSLARSREAFVLANSNTLAHSLPDRSRGATKSKHRHGGLSSILQGWSATGI